MCSKPNWKTTKCIVIYNQNVKQNNLRQTLEFNLSRPKVYFKVLSRVNQNLFCNKSFLVRSQIVTNRSQNKLLTFDTFCCTRPSLNAWCVNEGKLKGIGPRGYISEETHSQVTNRRAWVFWVWNHAPTEKFSAYQYRQMMWGIWAHCFCDNCCKRYENWDKFGRIEKMEVSVKEACV